MKTLAGIIIICIAVVITLIDLRFRRRRLAAYWDRVCTGTQWKQRFPKASKIEIRQFLSVFVRAFGFRLSRRLSFSPDDRVLEVYRALHPPKWSLSDSMELETLAGDLERTYGVDVFARWREDITLGELFALIQRS
jgi:propanediol dehydratase small subunit